jgi:tyrosyl-tRNA synthetase
MRPVDEQLRELTRGVTDLVSAEELKAKLERAVAQNRPLRVKAGFDPTAPDLHLGHTVLFNKMRQYQELGHTVIFLVGDFTSLIGDPTGKSITRPPLTEDEVKINAKTYTEQVFKILDPDKTEVRFNSEWMKPMTAVGMIKLAAQYNVARMLERDDFRTRYREGRSIAIHEFLYSLVQAYDSVALKADVELGGHDQLLNLLIGRDIKKAYGLEPQIVMTVPLLEGTDGEQKMSKSLHNYVGIDESAVDIYGKTMSISDTLMWRWYELLSSRSAEELAALKQQVADGLNPRDAKQMLASEFVERFKGKDALAEAVAAFKKPDLEAEEHHRDYGEPVFLAQVLADIGFVKSNGEARRLIKQGAVKIEETVVDDQNLKLDPGFSAMVRCGKRRFAKLSIG